MGKFIFYTMLKIKALCYKIFISVVQWGQNFYVRVKEMTPVS